jgi:hypothetical protein
MSKLRIGTVGSDSLLAGEIPDRSRFAKRITNSLIDHLFIADHISFRTGTGMDGGRSDAAIKRAALLSDDWLGVWASAARFGNVVKHIKELAEQRSDIPDWQHGMQLWAGVGDNARQHVARGMEEMYRTPFEKFEKYSPYGSAQVIADFIIPYIENGACIFNIAARGENKETCIDTTAEVSEILHKAFPEL